MQDNASMSSLSELEQDLLPVCLTIGDSSGIGPEIAVKFLCWLEQQYRCGGSAEALRPVQVTGNIRALEGAATLLKCQLPQTLLFTYQTVGSAHDQQGDIAFQSLGYAVDKLFAKKAAFLLTGPISKENLRLAGLPFSGHTEILEVLANQYFPERQHQADMLFLYQQFRMLLLTRHVSLGHVSDTLDEVSVVKSLLQLLDFFKQYEQQDFPKLCVLGVNPHAGELVSVHEEENGHALVGYEEQRILMPAIRRVSRLRNIVMQGPVAADAAFRGFSMDDLSVDAYVAAYHDQGLIPFKMVAGLNAVNVTIGLPFLRTSVGHGTAPDIAGLGIARPDSLISAYLTGCKLYRNARCNAIMDKHGTASSRIAAQYSQEYG
jgi:4-hydroxy-L-threonine phosphate dehydrogenase PdxA